MDHKAYLESSYLDTSNTAKLFEEYKKAIPDLIIMILKDYEQGIEKLEAEKIKNLRKRKTDIQLLKQHDVMNKDSLSNLSDQIIETKAGDPRTTKKASTKIFTKKIK